MGGQIKDRPMWSFFWMFTKIALIGFFVIESGNLLQGATLQYLLHVNLPLVLAQMAFFVCLFQLIVYLSLRDTLRVYVTGQRADKTLSQEQIRKHGLRLLKFPSQLLRWFLLLAIFLVASFHFSDWWLSRGTVNAYTWNWSDFLQMSAYEIALAWLLAVMMYNGSRRVLRPLVSWVSESSPLGLGVRMSFRRRVVIVALSITVISSLQYLFLYYDMDTSKGYLTAFSILFAIFLILTYFFTRVAVDDTVQDINLVRTSLDAFNRLEFPQSTQRIKVESGDEVGELKIQVNALQEKAARYYERQAQELAMASRVQASLLPVGLVCSGPVRAIGHCQSAEDLGGDFFDIVKLDDGELAIIIGDVAGKGLPSALVTATMIGMFRTEVRHGGSASALLARMNRVVSEVLAPGLYVTAGVLIVDAETGGYQYASAGHLPPIYYSRGVSEEWEVCSLPLGYPNAGVGDSRGASSGHGRVAGGGDGWSAGGGAYPELTGRFHPGDRLILYTDGVLEARSETGQMVGFDRLHTWIRSTDTAVLGSSVAEIATSLAEYRGARSREDDETVVVVEYGTI